MEVLLLYATLSHVQKLPYACDATHDLCFWLLSFCTIIAEAYLLCHNIRRAVRVPYMCQQSCIGIRFHMCLHLQRSMTSIKHGNVVTLAAA